MVCVRQLESPPFCVWIRSYVVCFSVSFFLKVVISSSKLPLLSLQILMQTTSSGLSLVAMVEDTVSIPVQVGSVFQFRHPWVYWSTEESIRECIPLTQLPFLFLFKILDLEISFFNLAKAKEHAGKMQPCSGQNEVGPTVTSWCSYSWVSCKNLAFLFQEVFDYCIHS